MWNFICVCTYCSLGNPSAATEKMSVSSSKTGKNQTVMAFFIHTAMLAEEGKECYGVP